MKPIKRERNIYAALSVSVILLAVLFLVLRNMEAVLVCCGLTAVALFAFYKKNRLFNVATLICDNRIVTVPSFIVIEEKKPKQIQAEEAIVSTFGLILGNKVYPWGCEGVYGIRLREVQIDKEHICLAFGDDSEMLRVELLHGLTDKQRITEITQKLWHETGVRAELIGW